MLYMLYHIALFYMMTHYITLLYYTYLYNVICGWQMPLHLSTLMFQKKTDGHDASLHHFVIQLAILCL